MSTKRKEKEKEITYHYHKCLRARLNVMTSGMCNDACTAKPKTPLWKIQWDPRRQQLISVSSVPVLPSKFRPHFKWGPGYRTRNLPSLECPLHNMPYAELDIGPACGPGTMDRFKRVISSSRYVRVVVIRYTVTDELVYPQVSQCPSRTIHGR